LEEDVKGSEETPVTEINIFKFEIIKMCIDRLFAEFDEDEDEKLFKKSTSISFNLAFNTLKKLEIIKLNDNEDE